MIKGKSKILEMGVILGVGIIIGFLLGSLGNKEAYQKGLEKGLAQGREEVEEKYQKKIAEAFPSLPEPEEIYSVSGEIVAIENKILTLKETIYPSNPLEEVKERNWKVKIAEATEIVKRIEKTPQELAQETPSETPPSLFKEVKAEFSDLKVGEKITAESEENIKGKVEFEAKRIVLHSPSPL